jgi:hypothetical protein
LGAESPADRDEPDQEREAPREPLPPAEALTKGLGLLFQAALGTANAVKESVERGTVHRNISDAGKHLESAASAALRGLEQLVRGVGRPAAARSEATASPRPAAAQPPVEPTAPDAAKAPAEPAAASEAPFGGTPAPYPDERPGSPDSEPGGGSPHSR